MAKINLMCQAVSINRVINKIYETHQREYKIVMMSYMMSSRVPM